MGPKKRAAADSAAPKVTKKARAAKAEQKDVVEAAADAVTAAAAGAGIIIEACKSCGAFKTRAAKLEKLLKEQVPGIAISINAEKPRKGCFEVRTADGTTFVSLLDMPRPFTKLKALDIEQLAEEIAGKLKACRDR